MVDDAHGLGTLGETGAGVAEHFGLDQDKLPVLMGTLGKAFGTFGAFVAGSEEVVETLIQHARTYIYTTALPPAVAAATLASLNIIRNELSRREHLTQLIRRFKSGVDAIGFCLMSSETAIQPIVIGSESLALEISRKLESRGLLITAIRPPTVPKGTSRLRVTLSASHTLQQLDVLLTALSDIYNELSANQKAELTCELSPNRR